VTAEPHKASEFPLPIGPTELVKDELRWSPVTLNELFDNGLRMEASVFDIDGKHARDILNCCEWPLIPLCGTQGMATNSFYPGRFKRFYCDSNSPNAVGFLGSSEMLDIHPMPVKFISAGDSSAKAVKVERGFILLSRSGTIGNATFVSTTLERYLISEHAIRIIADYPGYIYSYLKTDIGQSLVKSSIYGAVVDQVEPEHLERIPIPNPSKVLKMRIHDLIVHSYNLRDESNALLDEAKRIFYNTLNLPPLKKLRPSSLSGYFI